MNGDQLPLVTQDEKALALATRYAPIILADEREPFPLVAAGYTIFDFESASPSFKRRIEWSSAGYPAVRAIEYALWWDWDIGHLYELEHVWTFIGASGQVVAVEASWHGMFGPAEGVTFEETHPILFAQPGKHAMAASSEPFNEIRAWAEQEAGPDAGKDGLLENEMFRNALHKTPEADAKVRAYLKARAFTPTWNFTKRMPVTRDMLVPWNAMRDWVPPRVAWWLTQIQDF